MLNLESICKDYSLLPIYVISLQIQEVFVGNFKTVYMRNKIIINNKTGIYNDKVYNFM